MPTRAPCLADAGAAFGSMALRRTADPHSAGPRNGSSNKQWRERSSGSSTITAGQAPSAAGWEMTVGQRRNRPATERDDALSGRLLPEPLHLAGIGQLLRGHRSGAAAGAAPGPGGGQTACGSFADQGGLELGQRPEDVEDQQPGRVVGVVPSVRDRNPTPAVARSVLTVPIR